jgi:hypothetical protein
MGFVDRLKLFGCFSNREILEKLVSAKINSIIKEVDSTIFSAKAPLS